MLISGVDYIHFQILNKYKNIFFLYSTNTKSSVSNYPYTTVVTGLHWSTSFFKDPKVTYLFFISSFIMAMTIPYTGGICTNASLSLCVCMFVVCVSSCLQYDLYLQMHYFKTEQEQLSADLLPRRIMTCQLREVLQNIFILFFFSFT